MLRAMQGAKRLLEKLPSGLSRFSRRFFSRQTRRAKKRSPQNGQSHQSPPVLMDEIRENINLDFKSSKHLVPQDIASPKETPLLQSTTRTLNKVQDKTPKLNIKPYLHHYPFMMHQLIKPVVLEHHRHIIMPNLPRRLCVSRLKKEISRYSLVPWGGYYRDSLIAFLKDAVFQFRSGLNPQPLTTLIIRMEKNKELKSFITDNLIERARIDPGEFWATGFHEWLPRNLIIDVLKRSAAMVMHPMPFVINRHGVVADWLFLATEFRSPIKRLYFNRDKMITSGHIPSIKNAYGTPSTVGSYDFHQRLEAIFEHSQSLGEFVRKTQAVSDKYIIDGASELRVSPESFYTVDGLNTANIADLRTISRYCRNAYKEREALFSQYAELSEPVITVEDETGALLFTR